MTLKTISFRARIVDRQLSCFRDTIDELGKFYKENYLKDVDVTITTDIDTRSKAQNRFFHGCIMPAVQRILLDMGHPSAASVEYVKEVILKKPYLTVNRGEPDEYIRATSSLAVGEFWEFCNWCVQLIINLGGSLNQTEQAAYMEIIKRYHLEEAMDYQLSLGV